MNAFPSESPSDNRKLAIQNPKSVGFLAIVLTLACGVGALAQQQTKIPKIGWLGARSASAPALSVLRRELRALGYVEGKNIAIEARYAEDKIDRLPALAEELVRLKVDVLFTPSTNEALFAKKATKTIPVVFVGSGDPVAAGLVESLGPGEISRGSPALRRC